MKTKGVFFAIGLACCAASSLSFPLSAAGQALEKPTSFVGSWGWVVYPSDDADDAPQLSISLLPSGRAQFSRIPIELAAEGLTERVAEWGFWPPSKKLCFSSKGEVILCYVVLDISKNEISLIRESEFRPGGHSVLLRRATGKPRIAPRRSG
jgi:hypothetical protein